MEEEEKIVKGDDFVVDLDASLEDLYMGGSLKVCEQCPNVKYVREGYFITVDIEKGMQDGQGGRAQGGNGHRGERPPECKQQYLL